jgi:gamma-glutamyltranspeptidase/glutathione hydrolase
VLNNSVASFGSVGRNVPEPNVRTMSSMAPTHVLLSETDLLALGSPGGDTIPSTITQLVVALVDDHLSLKDAVERPRIHQGFVPDEVSMERLRPLSPQLRAELQKMGHQVRASRSTIGDANVAAWLEGRAVAVYDSREGGLAESIPE